MPQMLALSNTLTPIQSTDPTLNEFPPSRQWSQTSRRRQQLRRLWCDDIDTAQCAIQMNCYYAMSGYINTVSFSAAFIWCGFQSGNTAQLAIAMARLWENESTQFLVADRQALTSLLAFLLGCLFARIVERIGVRTRGWMWLGTMVQAALTAAAAGASVASNQGYPGISDDRFKAGPAWDDAVSFVCLGLMSASMGMQGLMSLRLKTNSGATLPLTTTWVELLGVQALSNPKRLDTARDQRIIGILSVVLGALTARGLIFKLGSPGALGMAAGFRALVAFSWIFVPSESPALVPTTPSATAGDEKSDVQVTSQAIPQVSDQSSV